MMAVTVFIHVLDLHEGGGKVGGEPGPGDHNSHVGWGQEWDEKTHHQTCHKPNVIGIEAVETTSLATNPVAINLTVVDPRRSGLMEMPVELARRPNIAQVADPKKRKSGLQWA